jgi:hypothetical protein
MASNTRSTWKRRLRKKSNAGRKRKNQEGRRSTLPSTELFASFGEPGQAAPKLAKQAAK